MPEDFEVTIEDLSGQQREVADIIGFENYMKLVHRYGGLRAIYLPKMGELRRAQRNREILSKFDGYNFSELAQEYDLSEQQIREITRPVMQKVRNRPFEDQITLFEK